MVKRIAILSVAALIAVGASVTWRHLRAYPLTQVELTKFLLPPSAPKRLKEGCSDLRTAIAAASSDPHFTSQAPVERASSLSQDEVAVYRAVLGDTSQRGWKRLNVSATTEPLSAKDFEACACFDDIDLENLPAAFHRSHHLPSLILPTEGMRLVDPTQQSSAVHANDPSQTIRDGKLVGDAVNAAFSTGLFSMSEIAFDKEHRHAVVSYGFWCGMLCGNGATLIFEKIENEWKRSDRDCGSWIS